MLSFPLNDEKLFIRTMIRCTRDTIRGEKYISVEVQHCSDTEISI